LGLADRLAERYRASRGASLEDLLLLPVMVAALPDREREIVVLRFFEDLDQDAIAARSGKKEACRWRSCEWC